jgi:hypothetical protein
MCHGFGYGFAGLKRNLEGITLEAPPDAPATPPAGNAASLTKRARGAYTTKQVVYAKKGSSMGGYAKFYPEIS